MGHKKEAHIQTALALQVGYVMLYCSQTLYKYIPYHALKHCMD